MFGMDALKRRTERSHRAEYTHAWKIVSESQKHYGGSMSVKCSPYSLWYVQLFYSQTETAIQHSFHIKKCIDIFIPKDFTKIDVP